MTAKEFIKSKDQTSVWCNSEEDMYDALREFAKFHVKAALKAASKLDFEDITHSEANDYQEAVQLTIKECYPLENIK